MKRIKLLSLILLFALLLVPRVSRADAYVIHLFYNPSTQSLRFDTSLAEKVAVDKNLVIGLSEFLNEKTTGTFVFRLYDAKNIELLAKEFKPQVGAFNLEIPYFSLATEIKIFSKGKNEQLLETSIAALSTCNGNGICEFEKGETAQDCLEDCASSHVTFSQDTQQLLNQNNGTLRDQATGKILLQGQAQPSTQNQTPATNTASKSSLALILLAATLLLASIGFLIYKKFKK